MNLIELKRTQKERIKANSLMMQFENYVLPVVGVERKTFWTERKTFWLERKTFWTDRPKTKFILCTHCA